MSAKTGSEYKTKNSAVIVAILAVIVVAALIVCSLPVSSENGNSTDASLGETHTVRYHLNYSGDLNENYNVTTINAGDGSSSDPYIDVVYYGTLVSTEYNPQLWAKTIVNRSDVKWNWLEINDYVKSKTVVFTGWRYHNATSGETHYPGEVLSKDDIENHLDNGVINVYATWGTVDNAFLVSNGNRTLDGRTAYSLSNALNKIEGGSSYTNFLLIYGSTTDYGKVSFNSYTIGKPVTIRTDPVSEDLNKTMGRLYFRDQIYMDADLTIDNLCLFGGAEGTTHGQGGKGIYARGHTLILGTGILSINTSSGDNAFKGYPQLFGGSNTASTTYADHPDVNVYPTRNDNEEIDTLMIVHSGTWYNVNGGSRYGTIPGSTCTVIKNAVILDTYNGAGLVGDSNSQFAGTVPTVEGVARSYFIDSKMPADTYGENILTNSVSDYNTPIPYYITETNFKNGSTLPEWPYRVDDADALESTYDRIVVPESTIITGGSKEYSRAQDTVVYISGESIVYDAQAATRTYGAYVYGTGFIEVSGKATVTHVLCGSMTDGTSTAVEGVKNTHVVVKDVAKVATICGAGYDTWSAPNQASMIHGGSITVEVLGGTVGDIYGGGYRGNVGYNDNKFQYWSDGTSTYGSNSDYTVLGTSMEMDSIYQNPWETFTLKYEYKDTNGNDKTNWSIRTVGSNFWLLNDKNVSHIAGWRLFLEDDDGNLVDHGSYPKSYRYYTTERSNMVFRAIYEDKEQAATVTLNYKTVDDSSNISDATSEYTSNVGATYTLPAVTGLDSGYGTNFLGWLCDGRLFSAGGSYVLAGNEEFTALYKDESQAATVTFKYKVDDEWVTQTVDTYVGASLKTLNKNTLKLDNVGMNKDGWLDSISISMSDGKILGSIYGGGSGGLDKVMHTADGLFRSGGSGVGSSTGLSRAYVKEISIDISGGEIEGSVYGGGKSVPIISNYYGRSIGSYASEVAAVVCDTITVSVSGSTTIVGDVYGGGRGVDVTSSDTVAGADSEEYTHIPLMTCEGDIVRTEWITGVEGSTTDTITFNTSNDANNKYVYYANVNADSITVNIEGSDTGVSIGSCVYGAGARSRTTADTVVNVGGTTSIVGSVYGAGLMRDMYGSTDVNIYGGAEIQSSVYGGADIGTRSSSSTEVKVLVHGTSDVNMDGSNGASVAMSILGGGNSCLVLDDRDSKNIVDSRIVVITDYVAPAKMESLQSATQMDIIRSTMYLDGRGTGETATPSLKYSLYDIDELNMISGSKLGLSQSVDEVREYNSYITEGTLTTMSNPSNTIVQSSGVMFNTSYESETVDGYREYGLISGYTILAKDISEEFYGAYAYGSQDSTGHFVQTKDGLYELIHYVDKDAESTHDEFRLWTLSGAVKQNMVMVATYNGSDSVATPTEDVISLMSEDNDRTLLFTGATVSMEQAAASLVSSTDDILNAEDLCIVVGYGSESGYTRFNYDSLNNTYTGVPITGSFACSYVGSEIASISKINIGMWYRGDIPFTGSIGRINLEFQEVVPISVSNETVYVPINTAEVIVDIYCMTSTSLFAGTEEEIEHEITISVDDTGSGSGMLVIPYGFTDSVMTLDSYTIEGGSEITGSNVEMYNSVSAYGTSGWIGAVGRGGDLDECVDIAYGTYQLSGSFSANLRFDINGVVGGTGDYPYLHFTIVDNSGVSHYFSLKIHIKQVTSHNVEFYAPVYDYNVLKKLSEGSDVKVMPLMYGLVGVSGVDHGQKLQTSDYPLTYDYFQGWYLNPDFTKYFDPDSTISEDMKLYGRYDFKVMFHLYDATYQTFYEDIVSSNIARLAALYEDPTTPVRVTYSSSSGSSICDTHLGATIDLPSVSATGFKGWLLDGRLYSAGDEFIVYSTQTSFTAFYEGTTATATVVYAENDSTGLDMISIQEDAYHLGESITLPTYSAAGGSSQTGTFKGWVYNSAIYQPGASFVIIDDHTVFYALFENQSEDMYIVTSEKITAHPGSEVVLPLPAIADNFRGWMIDGAFYYTHDSSSLTVLVPGNSAVQEIYADASKTVSIGFGGQATSLSKTLGESFQIPNPNDAVDGGGKAFIGWYCDGKVYQSGDRYVVLKDAATLEFVPMYDSETSSHVITVSDGTVGVLSGHAYPAGTSLTVPVGVDWSHSVTGDGTQIDLVSSGSREDFRGWKVGSEGYGYAYYFMDERVVTYVVSTEDQVAVPVLVNDSLPAYLSFGDDADAITSTYGNIVTLPTPGKDGFLGWYSKGYSFPAGYSYVVTDEHRDFTAMYEDDSYLLEVGDGMVCVLDNNVYTSGSIRVPMSVTGWDAELTMGTEVSDITVDIDFGDSMNGIQTYVGETLELPDPVYSNGFKGWLAGGVLYKPSSETGVCTYTVLGDYSYIRPIDVSEDMLVNPGYYTDGKWYDDDGNLRFYDVDVGGDHEGEFVDDIDHIVDDTVFHLNWIGKDITVRFIAFDSSSQFIDMSDYNRVVQYDTVYGRPIDLATAHVQSVLGDVDVAWEIAVRESSIAYGGIGEFVSSTTVLKLEDYKSTISVEDDLEVLYLLASTSSNAIDVLLYPCQQYIPQSGDQVSFEAVFEKIGSTETKDIAFDINADGSFDSEDVTMTVSVGETIVLPMPDVTDGFVGWLCSGVLYVDTFVMPDVDDMQFTPLYDDSSNGSSSVKFTIDLAQGSMTEYPESSEVTVSGYIGQTIVLPDVEPATGYRFVGWMENGCLIDEFVLKSAAVEILTALLADIADPGEADLVFAWDSDCGACLDSDGNIISGETVTLTGNVGGTFDLPKVAPMPGYLFSGWRIAGGSMAQDSGTLEQPTRFKVLETEDSDGNAIYTFSFNEGQRIGYYLSGWEFLLYSDSNVLEHVYVMGETVTVKKVDDEYRLYYDDNGTESYYVVSDSLEFDAIWSPMEYTIEIQAPYRGTISYWLANDKSNITEVNQGDGTVSITLHYGDILEFKYDYSGNEYEFNRWSIKGQGEINDVDVDNHIGALTVTGDASLEAILKLASTYVINVYKPAVGEISLINTVRMIYDYGTYASYLALGGTEVTVKYNTSSEDTIHNWYVNRVQLADPSKTFVINVDGNKTVVPILTINGIKSLDDVYAAFAQDETATYALDSITIPEKGDVIIQTENLPEDVVFSSSWASGSGNKLLLTLTGEDVRGAVSATVTVDCESAAYQFRVHLFIVGPVEDGSW